ncbi:MAG: hypothetical protein IJ064_00395 [Bacteroidaceae bacterium]|nr:hypothetical protein [Bacteroidaceae bacterium]
MKRIVFFLCLMVWGLSLSAQTALDKSPLGTPSLISPYYFGPNAFAVPDMLDGRVSGELRIELAGDHFFGKRGDHTSDVALKVNVPLWTRRANLTLWMPVMEWYRNTDRNIAVCRIQDAHKADAKKGHLGGDVYVSIDMQLLKEKRVCPDWTLRAALKTASGGEFYHARYYDSPGYFFDTSLAKSFVLGHASLNHRLRVAATTGFLCWQTDNGRQNDAVQYGVMLKWETRYFSLSQTLGGYNGWEHNASNGGDLAHDCPMTLKTQFSYNIRDWEIVAAYQYGLRDYPYQQARLGLAYNIDILKHKK